MSSIQHSTDPFYTILSEQLQAIRGGLSVSLTDRRGDLIAKVMRSQAEGAPSEDELSLIHVYGQLAYQQAPSALESLSVERGTHKWFGHRIIVDTDLYDLWFVCVNNAIEGSTHAEMEQHIQRLEKELLVLLKGHSHTTER